MNKTDLISSIQSEHCKLTDALARLKQDQMEISGSEKIWTVKETLVHITSWEQVLLADHARLSRGEPIHEVGSDAEINALNAITRSRAGSMPLEQVLTEFHDSFTQIIEWLDKLPEQELSRPFAYGMTLGEFIGEDTWKHYAEHLIQITPRAM
jgi:hypothetical protein